MQLLDLNEVRIEVNQNNILFAMKFELIGSNSALRAIWKLMTVHGLLLVLGLKFVTDGT